MFDWVTITPLTWRKLQNFVNLKISRYFSKYMSHFLFEGNSFCLTEWILWNFELPITLHLFSILQKFLTTSSSSKKGDILNVEGAKRTIPIFTDKLKNKYLNLVETIFE